MEIQEMEITIDNEGKVQVTVKGAHGPGCVALTKELENAVGDVQERTHLAEFYEQPEPVTTEQHRYVNGK